MSQVQKLIARLLSFPKDFTWEELVKILNYFGFKEIKTGKTGGSRRKFSNSEGLIISLHKPHPAKIMKRYQLDDVVSVLKERGYLNE
jgi:hypothetical protein